MLQTVLRKAVMRAFDRWASSYTADVEAKLAARGYSYDILARIIVEHLQPTAESILLELGIGTGVLAKRIMALTNATLIGLDISRQMLCQARIYVPEAILCHGSAESILLPDGFVHGLYSAFMFHSVPDQRQALSEMWRVLALGGRAAIVDLCPIRQPNNPMALVLHHLHSIRREYGAPSFYQTPDQITLNLREAGFDVNTVRQLGRRKDYTHFLFCANKEERNCEQQSTGNPTLSLGWRSHALLPGG
jgi:ubiquinone/menaquinone biosynthesis C-methylase UbiE